MLRSPDMNSRSWQRIRITCDALPELYKWSHRCDLHDLEAELNFLHKPWTPIIHRQFSGTPMPPSDSSYAIAYVLETTASNSERSENVVELLPYLSIAPKWHLSTVSVSHKWNLTVNGTEPVPQRHKLPTFQSTSFQEPS